MMKEFKGISASPGISIGKVFLYMEDNVKIPHYQIAGQDVKDELKRFNEAIEKAVNEIHELKKQTSDQDENQNQVLDSHIMMLNDPEFKKGIEKSLQEYQKNIEWIMAKEVEAIVEKLNSADDTYLRERSADIHDVSKRVLNHLMYRENISLADLSEEYILVTHNLLPSETVAMNKRMVKGIAMDAGGKTSHTAILARSFEIPAVLGLSDISKHVSTGDSIILDGYKGVVIIKPDDETRKRYQANLQEWQKREVSLLSLNDLPAETTDGKLLSLKANIEVPEEIDSVKSHGADGIGLYRSEFLFIQPGVFASEEEQYQSYYKVLTEMKGKSVTIRTLDVGGDKVIPDMKELDEKNPILGWRAVRFCLSRKDIFKRQLRALFRASVHGDLRIMFPMISGVEELENVFAVVEEVKNNLAQENIPFDENTPIGIMIEVPSAAVTSDILAKRVQFFSIGTNDLIQYTVAVDRGNERVAYLYEPFHPGVLRLLRIIIDNAHEQSIPVGMCGEMAGDALASVILLGLGLDEYSMSAFRIPEIKTILRSVSIADAEELVGTIMEMKSYKEIDRYVTEWMEGRFDVPIY